MAKIPQIHIDVLNSYKGINEKRIVGMNLTQIADGFHLGYTPVYILSVTLMLIKKGFLIREQYADSSLMHTITPEGFQLLALAIIEPNLVEASEEPIIFKEISTISATKMQSEPVVKEEPEDKEKAILSLINETLLKTVIYCKDLSDQLGIVEREKRIAQAEQELIDIKNQLRRSQMIVAKYEQDTINLKEKVPMCMDLLKCSFDARVDEHYNLIPWQRELAKTDFKKDIILLIEETLQDVTGMITPDDNN